MLGGNALECRYIILHIVIVFCYSLLTLLLALSDSDRGHNGGVLALDNKCGSFANKNFNETRSYELILEYINRHYL